MPDDSATKSVEEILKTLIATSGIMLALLWGLTQKTLPHEILVLIRHASIVLIISIISCLLGMQFIVSAFQSNVEKPAKLKRVAVSFFIGWVSFIGGCIAVIYAIYHI